MRVSGQLVAFGAMMLVGEAFLPASQAHAFGPQWRPTVAHAPAQARSFRRVANVPSFRPRVSAASPRYQTSRSVRTQRAMQPVMQPMVAMRPMAPPTYQGTRYAPPNVWSAMPMWSNPFAQMAQVWQYPAPAYPRQFAWHPAERPWISQRVQPEQHRDRYTRPAPLADYRVRDRFSAVGGMGRAPAWRDARPIAANGQFRPSRPALAGYRPVPGRLVQRQPMSAQQFAAAGMQRGYWRPDRAAPAPRIAHGGSFRPVAYGRASAEQRLSTQQRVAAQQLPGWATTYRDEGDLLTCAWCGGS